MFQDLKFPCFALVLCVLCEESSQELLVRSTKNSTRLTSSSAAAWLASPRSQIPLLRYYSVLLSRSSLLIIVPALPVASLARSLTLSGTRLALLLVPCIRYQPTNTTTKPVMLLVLMLSSVSCLARRPFSSSSTHTLVLSASRCLNRVSFFASSSSSSLREIYAGVRARTPLLWAETCVHTNTTLDSSAGPDRTGPAEIPVGGCCPFFAVSFLGN